MSYAMVRKIRFYVLMCLYLPNLNVTALEYDILDQPILFQEFNRFQAKRAIKRQPKKPPCDEERLIQLLVEAQAINPESIIKSVTLEELETFCKQEITNFGNIQEFLHSCEPPQLPDLYMRLIKGIESLSAKLCCPSSKFKTEFCTYFKCISDLRNDYEDCAGFPDWIESEDTKKVCQEYKNIADCYYKKTAKVCGLEAARAMKEIVVTVIDSILTVHCKNIKSNPSVPDAMPAKLLRSQRNKVTKIEPHKHIFNLILIHFVYVLVIE